MKKLAILFVLSVLIPSMVLGWLASKSVKDQQIIIERQQSLLYQGVVDSVARSIHERLREEQTGFVAAVTERLASETAPSRIRSFDQEIKTAWPLAKIGFVVTTEGTLLSPMPQSSPSAREFVDENGMFLANRGAAEVYQNSFKGQMFSQTTANTFEPFNGKVRNVAPQQTASIQQSAGPGQQQLSKYVPLETEFNKVVGEAGQGIIARFVNNELSALVWHRPPQASNIIYGAELDLLKLASALRDVVRPDDALQNEICLALLNDAAKPVVLSRDGFKGDWKRPFVASEVGEELPHWEVAAYILDPARVQQTARAAQLTLWILIGILIATIGTGTWLIITDMDRQMRLARLKTDFVSNVSHELKTPLTSIRMFSELLAEGRVSEPEKQRAYLGIINLEASRLTRLINNVLDFARMDRGEKRYQRQRFDLAELAKEMCDTYRAHLEQGGFTLNCEMPAEPVWVCGDRDALAQIVVNLLSNAEKYSESRKEISVSLALLADKNMARLTVADRGLGIPAGCEEKIFEQFYRAHDGLNSKTQGSGLGLTLARQIARAHGGDVLYRKRDGGGSCFDLEIPTA